MLRLIARAWARVQQTNAALFVATAAVITAEVAAKVAVVVELWGVVLIAGGVARVVIAHIVRIAGVRVAGIAVSKTLAARRAAATARAAPDVIDSEPAGEIAIAAAAAPG